MSKTKQSPKPSITLNESLDQAIADIKNSGYKGTAIKIELEAQLSRNSTGSNEYCDSCDGNGAYDCGNCDGNGCSQCNEGTVDCSDCDGSGMYDQSSHGSQSEEACHQFILNNVSKTARNKLVFSRFYYDGSVDSELTFTLMIEDVKYAIEFVEAFKKLGDYVGNGLDTSGAGMHIAILNSKNGYYSHRGGRRHDGRIDFAKFANFAKSMNHLMPALFFLGSCDSQSRDLHFRMPACRTDKYNAVHGTPSGALEFRVFETCYQRPEALFDFVCVIAKCLKFYASKQVKFAWFGKVGNVSFKDTNRHLDRFYQCPEAIKALDLGLQVLKPDHKTITELKKERNFKLTLPKVINYEKKLELRWRVEFSEYKERAEAELQRYLSSQTAGLRAAGNDPGRYGFMGTTAEYLRQARDQYISDHPQTLREYISYKKRDLDRGSTVVAV